VGTTGWIITGMNAFTQQDARRPFVIASLAEISCGFVAILLGWLLGPDARQQIPSLSDVWGIAQGCAMGGLLGAMLAAGMFWLSRMPWDDLQRLNRMMEDRFREFLAPMTYIELMVLALAAGIGEELLFRGWLQAWLIGAWETPADYPRVIFGWLVASGLFGLAHPMSRSYILLAMGMGLVLGGVFLVTGNLLTAIVAHAVYDAVILVRWKADIEAGRTGKGTS